jgi:peptide/nickel transport system ATP-binding protein
LLEESGLSDLIEVRDLSVEFDNRGTMVPALDRVSFRIPTGSTVALVGESGSGKSVTAQAIMGILPKTAHITSGEILFTMPDSTDAAVDVTRLDPDGARIRGIRGRHISMIFQEPMVSLSPLHTVGDQVSEALFLHHKVGHAEGMKRTEEMLRLVGFPNPARALTNYPFELSGGLRQRAMIAMALVCRPSLLIADEPTTALDVTIQAQILALIKDLQSDLGMAVLIITHDLGVVANLAQEVVVLYGGRVMEQGPIAELYGRPAHPYLRALLHAVPHFDMKPGERLVPVRPIDHHTGAMVQKAEPWPADAPSMHLDVKGVSKTFVLRSAGLLGQRKGTTFRAVDNVSLSIPRGECFGLVGESGCGKTTLSKLIMPIAARSSTTTAARCSTSFTRTATT